MSHWQAVYENFKNNNVARAISQLEEFISSHDAQKFACVVGASFLNHPSSVLAELNRFIEANEKQFDVKSVYFEMNGFDINYDRWYFDLFAYSSYSPNFDDTDWLCEWQSAPWPQFELTGMAAAQEAFAWYHEKRIWKSQPDFKPIYEAAMLLIMAKFAGYIGSALRAGHLAKSIPILVTAHGFESIARYEP
ncbi:MULTISPECIES: hypothetical protein [unclassified Methylophilus]|uniref:hypothetical protein n=1 Tax=unclassified Methylophilus TaxID=2630143 RepID=UPI0006FD5F10|nr:MULTISPECIES: hypothetical protein [unclassified Methylophilus]KQT35996.1 hypothetical protein ASG24_06875 [Methylophilus sp. Leaf414]KQT42487.1 hypothetical protein ASG34_07015 [Methylophilus sp. Leaf416]KQT56670.1 hypothetical protein ASG44_06990 [Methylophilus sp. Leaf459]